LPLDQLQRVPRLSETSQDPRQLAMSFNFPPSAYTSDAPTPWVAMVVDLDPATGNRTLVGEASNDQQLRSLLEKLATLPSSLRVLLASGGFERFREYSTNRYGGDAGQTLNLVWDKPSARIKTVSDIYDRMDAWDALWHGQVSIPVVLRRTLWDFAGSAWLNAFFRDEEAKSQPSRLIDLETRVAVKRSDIDYLIGKVSTRSSSKRLPLMVISMYHSIETRFRYSDGPCRLSSSASTSHSRGEKSSQVYPRTSNCTWL
jgi:hypothetical protein